MTKPVPEGKMKENKEIWSFINLHFPNLGKKGQNQTESYIKNTTVGIQPLNLGRF